VKWVFAIVVAWSSSTSFAGRLPESIYLAVGEACVHTLKLYGQNPESGKNDILKQLAAIYFAHDSDGTARRPFLSTAARYIDQSIADGRPVAAVGIELDTVFSLYQSATFTPETFESLLVQTTKDAHRVRAVTAKSGGEFSLAGLGVRPRHPSLRMLVRDFEKTGQKARLLSLVDTLYMDLYPIAQDFVNTFSDQWPEVFDEFQFGVQRRAEELLHRRGCYLPQSCYTPDGKVHSAGIYFPGHVHLPGLPHFVVHEMAHAVQDAQWNLVPLIEFYLQSVKPSLADRHGRPLSTLDHLVESYDMKLTRFTSASAWPLRQEALIHLGNRRGMTPRDWVIVFDFLHYLMEVDAHEKAALMAFEHGFPVPRFSRDELLLYVVRLYAGPGGEIEGDSLTLFQEREVRDWISRLNRLEN
jgi:hypothetical protein